MNTTTYLSYTQSWQNLLSEKKIDKIVNHLNSGFSFNITKQEYSLLKENDYGIEPKTVHYYFGISENDFCIIIIDDVHDKNRDHSKVLVKRLLNGLGNEAINEAISELQITQLKEGENHEYLISLQEALNRSFRWKLLSRNWLEHKFKIFKKTNTSGVENLFFPLISNPFEDLKGVFEPEDPNVPASKFAHHFFGLKLIQKESQNQSDLKYPIAKLSNYREDIIVTNITSVTNTKPYFADHSCFCPKNVKTYTKENYSLLPTNF